MSLVAVPRVVMRVLTVTALDKVFAIYDSVDDVVEGGRSDRHRVRRGP